MKCWPILLFFFYCGLLPAENADEGIAPVALVASQDGRRIYIAEAAARQIAILDVANSKIVGKISLPDLPSGLAISPDGKKLYVTAGSAKGSVVVIDASAAKIKSTWHVGHTPCAPVLSPD